MLCTLELVAVPCRFVKMFLCLALFFFNSLLDMMQVGQTVTPIFQIQKKIIQTMICPHVHCSVNKQGTYQSKFLIQNSVFFLLFQGV